MEVKDRKEQKRVSKQTFHKHSPLLTSSFVCVMDVLWDWWCWTQLLSIVSSKRQPKRITYHLSLCEGDLWWIWRTYEWSVQKKNGLNGERLHMGCKFARNRETIRNMHECQREMFSIHTLTQTCLHPLVCVWVYDVELAGGLGLVCWGWDMAGTHCLSGWVCEYKGITAYGLAHWQLWLCVCL